MAIKTIGVAPLAGKRYRHPNVTGVRRVLMRTTRYHVYYVVEETHVLVLAVWGAIQHRGPDLSLLGD